MVEFFFRNYTEDPWGGCQVAQNETNPDFDCHTFLEKNETVMDYQVLDARSKGLDRYI